MSKKEKNKLISIIFTLLFLIAGVIIGIPAYVGYFKTGVVKKFPSLIVS